MTPATPVHYYDEFIRYEGADGRVVRFLTDPDALEAHLLALAPGDAGPIREFTGALRDFCDLDLPLDLTPDDPNEGLAFGKIMLGHALPLMRWMKVTVRAFAIATMIWAVVGMSAGLLAAVQLYWPEANLKLQFVTFGRRRPLHTNAVIFAFVGNMLFAGVHHSGAPAPRRKTRAMTRFAFTSDPCAPAFPTTAPPSRPILLGQKHRAESQTLKNPGNIRSAGASSPKDCDSVHPAPQCFSRSAEFSRK